MNCQDIDPYLHDYFFHSLPQTDVAVVEMHLQSGCPTCHASLHSIASASSAIAHSIEPKDPPRRIKLDLLQKIRSSPQELRVASTSNPVPFLDNNPDLLHATAHTSSDKKVSLAKRGIGTGDFNKSSIAKIVLLTTACCFLAGYLGYHTSSINISTLLMDLSSNPSIVINADEIDTQKATENLVATTSMQFVSVKKSELRTAGKSVESSPNISDPQVLTGYVAYDAVSRQLHVGFRMDRDSLPMKRIRCTAVDSLLNNFELGELRLETNNFLTGVFDLSGAELPVQKLLLSDWNKPFTPGDENVFYVSISILPFGNE